MVGPQLSDNLHKKVFPGDFQPQEGILNKLARSIRELSSEKKVFCNVRKRSVPVCIAEREYENNEYAEVSGENVEQYFTRAGSRPSGNFGRGRPVVQRGRVFKSRGERMTTTNFEGGGMNFGQGTSRGKSRGGHSHEMEGRKGRSNTSNSVVCHNCDKDGHIARDCSKGKIKCYKCKELLCIS